MSYTPTPRRSDNERREVLSRPSATSLEYQGSITSQSAPSINNIIEKQSWEHRRGISDNFDPERRGHTFSRAGDDGGRGTDPGGGRGTDADHNNPRDGRGDDYQRGGNRNDNNHRYPRERSRDRYDDRGHSDMGRNADRHGGYREEGDRHHSSGRNHHDRNPGRRDSYRDEQHQRRPRNGHQPSGADAGHLRHRDNRDRRSSSREYHYDPPRNPDDQYNRRGGPDNGIGRPLGNFASRDHQRDRYNNGPPREDRPRRDSRYNNDDRRGSGIVNASGGGGGRNQHGYHHNSSSNQQPPGGDDGGWETVASRVDRRSSGAPRETEAPAPKIAFLPPNDSNSKYQQFMLLLAGVPGSGKSTLAESLVAGKPWMYVRVNQDTLGSRRECEDLTHKVLQDGKCPIIDRCNFDPAQRKHFLSIAASFKVPVDCVVFQYDMSLCIRRCQARRNHETITPQIAVEVVQRMVRQFSPPLPSRINAETFRTLKTIANPDAFNDVVVEYLNLI